MAFSSIKQIIKGHCWDFSSIEVAFNGKTLFDSFQEINYDWEADIGELRGNGSAIVKARTRGEFSFSGNVVLAKSDADEMIKILAALGLGGYGEAEFDLIVTYAERGQAKPTIDTLISCRLAGVSNSHSRSADPLFTSFDLSIVDILSNGFSPVTAAGGGGIAGAIGGLLP